MFRIVLAAATFAAALLALGASAAQAGPGGAVELRWLAAGGSVLATRTLDLQALEAMEQQRIETSTPWSDGIQIFTGPSLADIAELEPFSALQARVTALNDYSAEIPASDFEDFDPILATRHNGEQMRIRDKGPFWVMYPIDREAALDQQVFHARMVWQVRSIDFIAD